MKGVSNALVEVVQGAKFKASLWFVQKGYDFVFFEADVLPDAVYHMPCERRGQRGPAGPARVEEREQHAIGPRPVRARHPRREA